MIIYLIISLMIVWFMCGLFNEIKIRKIYKQLNSETKSFGFFAYEKKLNYIKKKIYNIEDEYYKKELGKIQICQKFFIIGTILPLALALLYKIIS